MMSLETNIGATKPGTNNKDGTQTSGGGGGGGGGSGGGGGKKSSSSMRPPPEQAPPPPPALKCPRCDSPNTKFCYYNNYNLSQPRHFCKTCRRYWTKGGALRSVPIGGGCRKNKKMKTSSNSSSSSSRFSGDSSSSCSDISGLKFFNGLSPAMDFQLGGLNLTPRTNLFNNNSSSNSQFSLFGGPSSSSCFNLDPLGFNGLGFQEMGNTNINQSSNIASSIESLSYINQDLHWKLQQQRLGLMFGGGGASGAEYENQHKESSSVVSNSIQLDQHQNVHQGQKLLQPILFQNLEITPKANEPPMGDSGKDCTGGGDGGGGSNSLATEWFFENCYAPVNVDVNPTPTTTTSNSAGNNQNGNNSWNGIQAWSDLNQYI